DLRSKKRKLMRKLKLSGRSLRPWLSKNELLSLAVWNRYSRKGQKESQKQAIPSTE
ncbi:hypothetical protein Tco_0510368, partial [Tanacetum coccineum]